MEDYLIGIITDELYFIQELKNPESVETLHIRDIVPEYDEYCKSNKFIPYNEWLNTKGE